MNYPQITHLGSIGLHFKSKSFLDGAQRHHLIKFNVLVFAIYIRWAVLSVYTRVFSSKSFTVKLCLQRADITF